MPYNMKSAIYSGLLSSASLSTPSPLFSCPSGNCTWEPFSTLAVGSRCTDVTPFVSLNCTNGTAADSTCSFYAPVDKSLSEMLQGANKYTFMVIEAMPPAFLAEAGWDLFNITGAFSAVQWVKALGNIGNYPPVGDSAMPYPYVAPQTTFEAVRCLFYFGVREVSATVTNGIYSEHVLNEYLNNGHTLISPWDGLDLVYQPPFAKPNENNNGTFRISNMADEIITSEFMYLLTGNVSVTSSAGFQGSDLILLLWMAQNMTRSMESVALYMTNALRGNDSELLAQEENNPRAIAPTQAVLGTVWIQEQIVVVNWAWLALPLAVIVAAAVFIRATIIRTSRASIGVWKNSPLALFFHGGPSSASADWQIKRAGPVDTADAIKEAAANIKLKIVGTGSDGVVQILSGS
ncbi:hypothetical protein VTN77DRAFT_4985 [Rasamsonia byssochlamydoides]|uniref:uncharacterized protein n=1 Tax=Rasamsonia byssochlamydoides TaxID=89139 RepID=UPI0037429936